MYKKILYLVGIFQLLVVAFFTHEGYAKKTHYYEKEQPPALYETYDTYYTADEHLIISEDVAGALELKKINASGKIIKSVRLENAYFNQSLKNGKKHYFMVNTSSGIALYDEQLEKVYTFPIGNINVLKTYGAIQEFHDWRNDQYLFLNLDTYEPVSEKTETLLRVKIEVNAANVASLVKETASGEVVSSSQIKNLKQVMPANFTAFTNEYEDIETIEYNNQYLIFVTSYNSLPEHMAPGILVISKTGEALKYIETAGDAEYPLIDGEKFMMHTFDYDEGDSVWNVDIQNGKLTRIGDNGWITFVGDGVYEYSVTDELYQIRDYNDQILYEMPPSIEHNGEIWSYPSYLFGSYVNLQSAGNFIVYDMKQKEVVYGPIKVASWLGAAGDHQLLIHLFENGKEITYVESLQNDGIVFKDLYFEQAVRQAIGKHNGPIFVEDVQQLERLSIGAKNISNIEGLQHFTNLKRLDLYGNKLEDISQLQALAKLEYLDISDNYLTNLDAIQGLKNLKTLIFANNEVENITSIQQLSNLLMLDMTSNKIRDFSALKLFTNLVGLFSGYNKIGADLSAARTIQATNTAPLEALQSLKNLKYLDLTANDIDSLQGIEKLTSLEQLDLSHNQITSVAALNALPNIEMVNLANNNIQDVSTLTNRNLQELNVAGNAIEQVGALASLQQLQFLNIKANPIEDLQSLSGSTSLLEVVTDDYTKNPIIDRTIYQEWDAKTTQDPFKVWTIKLSHYMDQPSLKNTNIFVKDQAGKIVRTELAYSAVDQTISVSPPVEGYTVGETYTLYIKHLTSTKGKALKSPTKMSFTITPDHSLNARTSMAMALNARSNPFVDGILTGVDAYQSMHNLAMILEKSSIYNAMIKEETGLDKIDLPEPDGSNRLLRLMYENEGKSMGNYRNCLNSSGFFSMCLQKLGQTHIELSTLASSNLLFDLFKETLSIMEQVHNTQLTKSAKELNNALDSSEAVSKNTITSYQNERKGKTFDYSWNGKILFIKVAERTVFEIVGEETLLLDQGSTYQYEAVAMGEFAGKDYDQFNLTDFTDTLWASFDSDIVKVTQSGVVTPLRKGEATIAAMYDGKIAKFNISVK